MKVGNVSQTVLKRSVLKQLHTKRKEILTDLSVEEMCTAVQIRDTEDVVFASATVSGNSKNIGVYAIMRAVLDLETRGASAIGVSVQVILPTYAYESRLKEVSGNSKNIGVYAIMRAVLDLETRGASAIGVSVQVILPTYAYESRLKEMFRCMEERCASWGIAITCAKAETSPAVSQSVVSVTAAGSVEKGQLRTLAQAEPNQEIVLCGSIAAEGVLRIFDEKREELSKRFVPAFMRQIQGTLAQAEPNQEIVLCGSIAAEGVLRIFDEKREELSKRFVPAFMRQIQGIESELEVFHALRSVKQENTPKGEPLVTAMQQIGSGGESWRLSGN